jgi:hypothetical protein
VPVSTERQLARLRARFEKHARDIAEIGFVVKGSVIQRFSRCGNTGCRCHDDPPRLHGPYWQWTSRVKAKTVSRMLTDEQAGRYQEWIDNSKRLEEIVGKLYELSQEADAILRTQERATPTRNVPRRRARSSS